MKFVCVFIALMGVCTANSIGANRPKRGDCNYALVQRCADSMGSGGSYPGGVYPGGSYPGNGYPAYPGGSYSGRPDYNNRRWMECCYRVCGSDCLDD